MKFELANIECGVKNDGLNNLLMSKKKINIRSNNSLSKHETLSKEVMELTKLRNKLLV